MYPPPPPCREKSRARSLNSCHPKERSRDIRALSNLDMNDGGLP